MNTEELNTEELNAEEKATILQYKHEEIFDNIKNDKDLITEAIELSMIDFPDIDRNEATAIADEVLNIYREILVN